MAVLLAVAYLLAVAPAVSGGGASLANGVGNAVSFFAFALFGLAIAGHLRRTGADLDAALARALTAEAQQARHLDHIAQYRQLHGTVLATLTDIASGTWNHRSEVVRARCERQADYLRRLIDGEVQDSLSPLDVVLDRVIAQAAETGLRVHYRRDDAGSKLPVDLLEALANPCWEDRRLLAMAEDWRST
jgi:hypothetical protein